MFGYNLLGKKKILCLPRCGGKPASRRTLTYETVYRSGKVNGGEPNSIASKLLETKYVFKNFCIHASQLTL